MEKGRDFRGDFGVLMLVVVVLLSGLLTVLLPGSCPGNEGWKDWSCWGGRAEREEGVAT